MLEVTMFTHNVLVSICTYGRPDGLAALLESLEPQLKPGDRVVVIDNNPDQSTTTRLRDTFDWVEFVHEPQPGIPAARNRALSQIADEWAIIFVDDDEVVTPGWLDCHREFARESDGGAFFGPVISLYGQHPDRRVVKGGILDRPRRATGTRMPYGATNNTLLKSRAVEEFGPLQFDERFTASGGSDVDFFARLRAKGVELYWNDDAVVYEHIPDDRATVAWSKNRYRRMGHNMAYLDRRTAPDRRILAVAVGRLLLGAARLPVERLAGRITREGSGRVWLSQGVFEAVRGGHAVDYSRKDAE
jgi:succinoglycan biosynthesis protein ExoM